MLVLHLFDVVIILMKSSSSVSLLDSISSHELSKRFVGEGVDGGDKDAEDEQEEIHPLEDLEDGLWLFPISLLM